MRPFAVLLLSFVLGTGISGFGQSGRTRTQNHPPSVDCLSLHAGPSCESFNAMLQDGNFTNLLTQAATTTFACFRQQEDAFVVLHFDSPLHWDVAYDQPEQRPQRNGKDVDIVKAEGTLTLAEYKQKVRGRSFNVEIIWMKAEPDPDRSATASASGNLHSGPAASVSAKEVVLSLAHMNSSGGAPIVDYSLQIQRTARRFVEEVAVAKTTLSTERVRIHEAGPCAQFSQPAP